MTTTNPCCEKCGIQVEDTQIMIPCEHCPCHQAGTSESKCPHPNCSHNTNGRDADKPCSIAWPESKPVPVEDWEIQFNSIIGEMSDTAVLETVTGRKFCLMCGHPNNADTVVKEIKHFIRETVTQAKTDGRRGMKEETLKNIGMLRQWLNEDRITFPDKMVTNEMLEHWLFINSKS